MMVRFWHAFTVRWKITALAALLIFPVAWSVIAGLVKTTKAHGASAVPAYTVTDMGTLGGSLAFAFAVNTHAQATGISTLAGDQVVHSFLWQNGTMTDLGTLGGSYVQANSINDSAQIVGGAYLSGDASYHAFLWQQGTMTDLGTLGGPNSLAWWVNTAGQVVGDSITASGDDHAFLWDHGVMHDLGTLGGASSVAFGIDDNGRAVGASAITNAVSYAPGDPSTFAGCHAFQVSQGTMTDPGTLGGSWSVANPSNNSGDTIGFSSLPGDANYAAFLYRSGVMHALLPVARDPNSVANGANDNGQVVGASGDQIFDVSPNRAVLWQGGTGMDLNTIIPSDSPLYLLWAFGINEPGQIVGEGVTISGEAHPFLLTPTSSDGSTLGKRNDHGAPVTMPAIVRRAQNQHVFGH
ncbi:MAG TPA: hypothetical protein VF792_07750 [Ktedonobacterales bacterium]